LNFSGEQQSWELIAGKTACNQADDRGWRSFGRSWRFEDEKYIRQNCIYNDKMIIFAAVKLQGYKWKNMIQSGIG
jgi:hypothetical protein